MDIEQWLGNSSLSSSPSGFRDLSLRGPCLSQPFRNKPLHDRHTQLFTVLLYGRRQKHHSSPPAMCRVRRPTSVHTATRGCRFSNREFATWLSVNAMGFRQTTQMDGPPRIAVLGDSHAMGWGVEDHETFASLIEQSLGEKVANLSVSSYGTAR